MCSYRNAPVWLVPRSLQSPEGWISRYTTSRGLFRQQVAQSRLSGLAPFLRIEVEDNSEAQVDCDTGAEMILGISFLQVHSDLRSHSPK
jgi:hypothetical protein